MEGIRKICCAVLYAGLIFFAACKKTEVPNGGKIKFITEDGLMYRAKVTIQKTEQTIDLLQIIRDSSNAAATAQQMTVQLSLDTTLFTIANTVHKVFPSGLYSLDESVVRTGNTWTVIFKPGQTAKTIRLKIPNAAAINFLNRYALPFTITTADANGVISANQKNIIAVICGTNKYTGRYRVTGTLVDSVAPAAINVMPYWDAELLGIGQDTVVLFTPGVWGDFVHPYQTGTVLNSYAQFSPMVIFNTATDSVKKVTNYWGNPAANTRSAVIDTGASVFNSTTHNIAIKYKMLQPSVMPSGNARVRFNETWKYIGP
jgi:Domain of unknown function (DUF1735)